jgi:hypothetical protein
MLTQKASSVATFVTGKSYTTSSCEPPQIRKEARINGCSGAI